ncbi:hypothetical protein C8N27_2120 [Tenacibaculum discolor]|nr:hypothetical protein C8N27_2120 [Tenacibaculum discolor]
MKKKLLHIIFLLCSVLSFSQHTYLFKYKASFSSAVTSNALYFENTITTNAGELFSVNLTRPSVVNIDEFKIVTFTEEITTVNSKGRFSPGFVVGCNNVTNNSDSMSFDGCMLGAQLITATFSPIGCLNKSIEEFKLIKIEDFKTINNYGVTGNELKSCEPKSLNISTHCSYYALEYKIPSNPNWEELLPYGNNPSIVEISQSDFAGLKVGENLQIRVRYTSLKGETNTNAYSGTLSYKVVGCSPQLQKPVVTQKTSCSYKNDGGFTLNFNRNLNSEEELVMTLYDGTDDSVLFGQEYTSTLTNNSGVYSYTWAEPLDAGSYRIKFQTHTGSGGIDDADDTWKSLEFSDPFTIAPATAVDFQVTGSADQNCFTVNDGYIDISATGESSRTFLYQLKKDNVIQIFNGTNWVNYTGNNADNETWFPFTNAKTTRISKLNKGAYSVKVRDSQGCLAKQ